MKLLKGLGTLLCLFVLCVLVVPSATADEWNRETVVTFSGPVEVPGAGAQTLPAGTYVFKIVDAESDRHIVRIFNADKTHIFTTIIAIPNYRVLATDKTVITFSERPAGQPEALRAWFYPGRKWERNSCTQSRGQSYWPRKYNNPFLRLRSNWPKLCPSRN